jgi:16S rRNA processing protein RimM
LIPEKEYFRIAKVKGAHGLDGKLKIYVISDIIERFEKGNTVYFKKSDKFLKYTVYHFQPVKKRDALLKVDGINDRNCAELFDGTEIFITSDDAESIRSELDEDTFFYHDIIGCQVRYDGKTIGIVSDIMDGGAGQILVIDCGDNKNVLIPFVEPMVDTSDLKNNVIKINPVEGLLDI